MTPAAILEIAKGIGRRAPTTIKNPPHLRIFLMCFAIFTSRYTKTEGILAIPLPAK